MPTNKPNRRLDRPSQGQTQFRRFRDLIGRMSESSILAWLVHLYTAIGAVVGFYEYHSQSNRVNFEKRAA